jgi:hypothetical protein
METSRSSHNLRPPEAFSFSHAAPSRREKQKGETSHDEKFIIFLSDVSCCQTESFLGTMEQVSFVLMLKKRSSTVRMRGGGGAEARVEVRKFRKERHDDLHSRRRPPLPIQARRPQYICGRHDNGHSRLHTLYTPCVSQDVFSQQVAQLLAVCFRVTSLFRFH